MRNILFKAKRKDNGEWVYWNIYGMICNKNGKLRRLSVKRNLATTSYYHYIHQIITLIDEKTICQYTGLTDKNGNKIWENNVVEVWWKQRTLKEDYEPKRYKAVVEFGNPNCLYSWGWQLRFLEDFPFNVDILLWIDMDEAGAYCEVIGNIFDNPELLGGQ